MKNGDIVKIEFEIYNAENGELLETTKEELAKEHSIHDEKGHYGPQAVIVGGKKLIDGLEESLSSAEVGKEVQVDIPPAKAYKDRNAELVELHSLREILKLPEFRRGDTPPYPGMKIIMRNRQGTITGVTAGRVRVDFNHPYAGRTLRYKYKVVEAASKPEEKVKAVLDMHYGAADQFQVSVKGKAVDIQVPDTCKIDQSWFFTKYRVVSDLREWVDMETVRIVEEYVKKAAADDKSHDHKGHDHHHEGHDDHHAKGKKGEHKDHKSE